MTDGAETGATSGVPILSQSTSTDGIILAPFDLKRIENDICDETADSTFSDNASSDENFAISAGATSLVPPGIQPPFPE